MLEKILKPEVKEMIEKKEWRELREWLSSLPAADIADLLVELENDEEMVIVFRLVPRESRADVFGLLDVEYQIKLIKEMSNKHIQDVISDLTPDDRTELFEELPGTITQRLLTLLPPEDRRESLRLLGYPENSVGRLMTPDYVAVHPDWTIAKALEHIRRTGKDAETINTVYVIDEESRLIDDLPLRRLILAPPEDKVESIMDRTYVAVSAYEDQEQAVKIVEKYDLVAIPVVDSKNVLIGIVTVDDILDVLEDEVTEDAHKGGAVLPLGMSYSAASVLTLYKKRIVWLSFLALSGFLTGNVLSTFQNTLSSTIYLAFFIPVLIGTGGNTSSQSATLVIRALALGDITMKKWLKVIKKEFLVGMPLGLSMGLVLFIWVYLWKKELVIALVVGISASFIVVWANIIGSILPIILTKIKLDPAVISQPLLSTFLDISGLLIYFSIATMIIK
ncbi:magnesium transporter [bacterium]|nr:MAG: magnesium transporter [bacterium]